MGVEKIPKKEMRNLQKNLNRNEASKTKLIQNITNTHTHTHKRDLE